MASDSCSNFIKTINHQQPDRVVVDFGSNHNTGIHVLIVEKLRDYYGLEKRPVKVIEPYMMLGEIDDELLSVMGIDVTGLYSDRNFFGVYNENWEIRRMPWGQDVLLPLELRYTINGSGDYLVYPQGDTSVNPSAIMPVKGYFFDAIERQQPFIESELNIDDNLEEYGLISEKSLNYWKNQAEEVRKKKLGVTASFGGTSLGSIALIPGIGLKNPGGIRGVAEWYLSTLIREDFVTGIFNRQTDIAIENLKRINAVVGDKIDVIFICGADFGTQDSTFCSVETFDRMWMPYYRKVNDWIHQNTSWKTFKHSCGAIESFMNSFIECGFDIINPVQINAEGMDTRHLKNKYGDRLVFWGGGVDTQGAFAFGTPEQVKDQVKRQCEILNNNGGFVFNTVHNVQANVPFKNVVAMLEALREIR
jgi:hypothetical protein